MDYLTIAKKFKAKKGLGQNFLVDSRILELISNAIDLSEDEDILEIGPGLGFLTAILAPKVNKLHAVEIDSRAIDVLNSLEISNLQIINRDILKLQLNSLFNKRVKVFANLPYYITTPILIHMLGDLDQVEYENRNLIDEIVLMVQKEVGQRITATCNSKGKDWGSLSILVNYWSEAEMVAEVSPKSFWPVPKVHSAIVRLKIRNKPLVEVKNHQTFKKVVRSCFLFRRKNIKNSLLHAGFKSDIILESLNTLQIKENIRGESLNIFELAQLADTIFENKENNAH